MVAASTVVGDVENSTEAARFDGTRVPVKTLFDVLENGGSLEQFIQQNPTVSQDQAKRVLHQAEMLIDQQARSQFQEEVALVERSIEQGRSILDRIDEDGIPLVSAAAFDRASSFLRQCFGVANSAFGRSLAVPAIQPGPDLSVDLHWRNSKSETLLNVPAESGEPISYYGDDQLGNSIQGRVVTDNFGGLVSWLTTRA